MINELHSIKAKVYSPVKMNTTLNAGIAKPEAGLRERVDEVEKQVEDLQLFDEEVSKALKQQDENTQTIVNKIVEIDEKDETQDRSLELLEEQTANLEEQNENQDRSIEDLQNQIVELEAENENLKNQIPTGQAEGENITLNDSSNMEFKELRIGGNSWQETRKGYNFLDKKLLISTIPSNWEVEQIENGVKVTHKSSYTSGLELKFSLKPNTKYTIYGRVGEKTSSNATLSFSRDNAYYTIINLSSESLKVLETSSTGDLVLSFSIDEGTYAEFLDLMLLEGKYTTSNIPPYEPYGAMPSPEFRSEIRNVGDNVNLFNLQNAPDNTWFSVEESQILKIKQGNGIAPEPIPLDINLQVGDVVTISVYCLKGKYINNDSMAGKSMIDVGLYHNGSPTAWQGQIHLPRGESLKNKTYTVTTTITKEVNAFMPFIYSKPTIEEDIEFYVKVEKGTKATPYSPYNCGNFNETVINENLFNSKIVTTNEPNTKMEIDNRGTITLSKNPNEVGYLFINKKLKELCPHLKVGDVAYLKIETTHNYKYIYLHGVSDSWFDGYAKTITQEMLDGHIAIYGGNNGKIDTLKIMITLDKLATEYQPHQSQQFTFPLSEGQRMYKESELTHRGVEHNWGEFVFNGTENWTYVSSNAPFTLQISNMKPGNDNTKPINFICSHYPPVAWDDTFINYDYLFSTAAGINILRFRDVNINNLEDWKTYLAEQYANGTPVTVEYELTEEVVEPYTEEQQLVYNEIKKAHSYKNVTHIFSTDEIKPILDVTYRKDLDAIGGDDYVITETDKKEIAETVEPLVRKNIQPTLNEIKAISQQAETIARGRATGYVFDTLQDLEIWLQNNQNISKLVLGDNFYIRELDVPDYWWDGSQKQQLEAEKPVLTGFVKEEELEDYATKEYIDILIGDIEKELGGI